MLSILSILSIFFAALTIQLSKSLGGGGDTHSRKPISHNDTTLFLVFWVWERNLSQHLYSTAVQKASYKGPSESGIINSPAQIGLGRSRLTFVLA